MEASRLSNGVTTVSVDNSSPVVHLGVYLGVGTGNETRANAGSLQVMKNAWYVLIFQYFLKLKGFKHLLK